MALDFGAKTVGVAVTDALGITAQGVEIIRRERETKLRRTLSRLEELARKYEPEMIVIGLPLNMDGTEGERCEKTRAFAEKLRMRLGTSGTPQTVAQEERLPAEPRIIFQDERLTTVAADEIMDEANVPKEKRNEYVDKIAATVILRDYLNQHENETRAGTVNG